jgi:hypothetical protein
MSKILIVVQFVLAILVTILTSTTHSNLLKLYPSKPGIFFDDTHMLGPAISTISNAHGFK